MRPTPIQKALGILVIALGIATWIQRYGELEGEANGLNDRLCVGVSHTDVDLGLVCAERSDGIVEHAVENLGLPGSCRKVSLPETLQSGAMVHFEDRGGSCEIAEIGRLPGEMRIIAGGRFDVNADSAADLMALPGIGPVKSERIVTERNENGPFDGAEDMVRVRGIGEKTANRLTPWLDP